MNKDLEARLDNAELVEHYVCDDPYYDCPGGKDCNCEYAERRKRILAFVQAERLRVVEELE